MNEKRITTTSVKSSRTDTKHLIWCDTDWCNSWVSTGPAFDLNCKVKHWGKQYIFIKPEERVETKKVGVTVTLDGNQNFEALKMSPYEKDNLNLGADISDVQEQQDTYPHLAALDSITYINGIPEMMLGQDFYRLLRTSKYIALDEKCSVFCSFFLNRCCFECSVKVFLKFNPDIFQR